MTKKIIYISLMHLSLRIEKDWFLSDLMDAGFYVEYWDLTNLFFGNIKENYHYEPDYVKKIGTYEQLNSCLRENHGGGIDFIIIVNQEPRFYKFFRLLKNYNCKMHFIHWGSMPLSPGSLLSKVISSIVDPFSLIKSVYNRVVSALYFRASIIKPFDVVFAAGDVALSMYPHIEKLVPINLIDYEKYISAKQNKERLIEGEYAVFCDINLPYQSDLKALGMPSVSADDYFFILNAFFDKIEEKHGVTIVIAEHPKAKYHRDTFNGRPVYSNLTAELIKDSKFIISHHSTSISYAVLNHLPIVFIFTDEMLIHYKKTAVRYINSLADYLGASVFNINRIDSGHDLSFKQCNKDLYDKFKYNYLTSKESENSSTKNIFISFFQKDPVNHRNVANNLPIEYPTENHSL